MKIKHKGKVYPSPSASSPPPSDGRDPLSLLLPATILALASVLSIEDREVLAYMITRSVKTPTTASTSTSKKVSRKQGSGGGGRNSTAHKSPLFDCDCFDCYTSYWYRWDSSSNRELIHQVIEAFEEHLSSGELSKKSHDKGKRKEKPSRRREKSKLVSGQLEIVVAPQTSEPRESINEDGSLSPRPVLPEKEVMLPMTSQENREDAFPVVAAAVFGHKGLARKVLPDVMGLLYCRLWNLWNPTV